MTSVTEWLVSNGLGEYAQRFAENGVDASVVRDLTEQDLKALGVLLGHRRRMLRSIAELEGAAPLKLQAGPKLVPRDDAERRQLTVMFCDLVGSTGFAAELDPEDLSGIIRRFEDTCAAVIKHFGGYIGRFMGDGLLVYFGYPQAHEDDAERAVRAGLDIVAKVGRLPLPSGEPLQVRVGIATGLVVVGETIGEGPAQEQAVFGEAPNLAAHLQQLAAPNSVLVAASTHGLLGSVFVCADLGRVAVKGKSKRVAAWRVIGECVVESRFEAMRPKRLTRFVGRQEQLSRLLNFWEQAKRGAGQVVLLCGEPGIGKSRISMHFWTPSQRSHISRFATSARRTIPTAPSFPSSINSSVQRASSGRICPILNWISSRPCCRRPVMQALRTRGSMRPSCRSRPVLAIPP
jgi:class 3 adenylate cyclase